MGASSSSSSGSLGSSRSHVRKSKCAGVCRRAKSAPLKAVSDLTAEGTHDGPPLLLRSAIRRSVFLPTRAVVATEVRVRGRIDEDVVDEPDERALEDAEPPGEMCDATLQASAGRAVGEAVSMSI